MIINQCINKNLETLIGRETPATTASAQRPVPVPNPLSPRVSATKSGFFRLSFDFVSCCNIRRFGDAAQNRPPLLCGLERC